MHGWLDEFAIHRKMQAKVEWLQTQLNVKEWKLLKRSLLTRVTIAAKAGGWTWNSVQALNKNKSISYEHDLFDKGWNQCPLFVIFTVWLAWESKRSRMKDFAIAIIYGTALFVSTHGVGITESFQLLQLWSGRILFCLGRDGGNINCVFDLITEYVKWPHS